MKKPTVEHRHAPVSYTSYVTGFVLSVICTLVAYLLVANNLVPSEILFYLVLVIAVIQLIVQLVFFLHLGRGSNWKLLTFIFTAIFVLIIVVGTVWVMHHLNYNMMDMNPEEMNQYMEEHEGI